MSRKGSTAAGGTRGGRKTNTGGRRGSTAAPESAVDEASGPPTKLSAKHCEQVSWSVGCGCARVLVCGGWCVGCGVCGQ
jgi:hypothetical protein